MVFAPISFAFKYELRFQMAFRARGVASDEAVGVRPGTLFSFEVYGSSGTVTWHLCPFLLHLNMNLGFK